MEGKEKMKFETERLLIREWKKGDEKDSVANINNLNVTKWLLVVPYPYTKKDSNDWIKLNLKRQREKKREKFAFAIGLKENKKVIGGIGLDISSQNKTAEVGYWLGENYWNKKYGSEALKEILNFGFEKLKLRRIEAKVFEGNPSSGRLLEKFGFKLEGRHPEAMICKSDGKIKTDLSYGLLKKDWEKLK